MINSPSSAANPGDFHTTRWSRVCDAKEDTDDGKRALAELCEAYYEPVIVYLHYELRDGDRARETAHNFFTEILAGGKIRGAERDCGRFRSYLLGSVKHFLANERAAQGRLKRGGGVKQLSFDETAAQSIPDTGQCPPDIAYDRQWATTLLGHALDALRMEYEDGGKADVFTRLKPWLTGEAEHGEQQALAASLGINLNTLKSDISRMKQRFKIFVKAEITGTVADGDSVRDELSILFEALRNR